MTKEKNEEYENLKKDNDTLTSTVATIKAELEVEKGKVLELEKKLDEMKQVIAEAESSKPMKSNAEVFSPYEIKIKNIFDGKFDCVEVFNENEEKHIKITTELEHKKVEQAISLGFFQKC